MVFLNLIRYSSSSSVNEFQERERESDLNFPLNCPKSFEITPPMAAAGLQRARKMFVNLAKQDPGRARQ